MLALVHKAAGGGNIICLVVKGICPVFDQVITGHAGRKGGNGQHA